MVRAGGHVGDDLGFRRVGHGRLEQPRDSGGASTEPDGFAEDLWIAAERGGPESIGQDKRAGGVRPIIVGTEQTAENRTQSHNFEIGSADNAGTDLAWFADADEGEAQRREVAERAYGLVALADALSLLHSEASLLN